MEFFEDVSCSQVCLVQLLKVFKFFTKSELINQSEKFYRYSVWKRNPDKISKGWEMFWFMLWTGRVSVWSPRKNINLGFENINIPRAMVFVNCCGKNTAELFPYLKWLIFKNLIYIWVQLIYSVISFCYPTKWISYTHTYIHSF